MDRGAWGGLQNWTRLNDYRSGKQGLWAFPVSRRLAHLFLTRPTAAPKWAWGCTEEEETPQQRRPLRSSLVRDAPEPPHQQTQLCPSLLITQPGISDCSSNCA